MGAYMHTDMYGQTYKQGGRACSCHLTVRAAHAVKLGYNICTCEICACYDTGTLSGAGKSSWEQIPHRGLYIMPDDVGIHVVPPGPQPFHQLAD